MAQACKTCTSEQRAEIEAALVSGAMLSVVSRQFSMNRDALARHRDVHMSPAIHAAADAVRERAKEDTGPKLLDRVLALLGDAQDILAQAKKDGKPSIALQAIAQARGLLDTYGRATGELKPDGAVTVQVLNVQSSTEWQAIRSALFRTFAQLENGEEARLLFAEEMRAIDGYEEPAPKVIGPRAVVPYRPPTEPDEEDGEEQDDA